MAYFDHNATTPLSPVARQVLMEAFDSAWQNPSSPYKTSARVHAMMERERNRLGSVLGCEPQTLIFSAGATEANNAVFSWLARSLPENRLVAVSRTEHPSVIEAARWWVGERVVWLDVDDQGQVDLDRLERLIEEFPVALVSVMAANNETGVLAPVSEISDICSRANVWYHCDASQWLGKLPAADLGIPDFLVGCAHKYGGPKGTGFLKLPESLSGFHASVGGEQEDGRRAGTENYPLIAAMVAALADFEDNAADGNADRLRWRNSFEENVVRKIPGARINARKAKRLWNTVSVCLPEGENHRWLRKLDQLGFEVSTGSACASGSEAPSHVLAAMDLSPEEARRTLRISSGIATSEADWRALERAFETVWKTIQSGGDAMGQVISV